MARANCSTVEPTPTNITRTPAVSWAARRAICTFSWAWWSMRAFWPTSKAPTARTTRVVAPP